MEKKERMSIQTILLLCLAQAPVLSVDLTTEESPPQPTPYVNVPVNEPTKYVNVPVKSAPAPAKSEPPPVPAKVQPSAQSSPQSTPQATSKKASPQSSVKTYESTVTYSQTTTVTACSTGSCQAVPVRARRSLFASGPRMRLPRLFNCCN